MQTARGGYVTQELLEKKLADLSYIVQTRNL